MATVIQPKEEKRGQAYSSEQFLTLYFPAFIFALGASIATPAIPVFAKSFDTGFGVASLVIVMHALGGLIAAVPSGYLVDRFGRRVIIFSGPLLMALSSALTAWAGSFGQLLAYRFIGGAAMEMWRQARLAIIADLGKERQRGRQITGMVGTESTGRLIGPAIGGVLGSWSIQIPFIAHAILSIVAILPSLFILRESAPGRRQRAGRDRQDELTNRELMALMINKRYRGFFCAQLFASMTRGVLWGGMLLLYATFAYDLGAKGLGGLATTSSIVGIPITLCCGFLMDRYGRKFTMVPGFLSMAVGWFFIAANAHWQGGLTLFIGAFLWVHSSHAVTSGSMQVLGTDMAPEEARGRFFGFWRMVGEIGSLVSPALFGFVAEHGGYGAALSMTGLFAVTTAGLLAFTVTETVGKNEG